MALHLRASVTPSVLVAGLCAVRVSWGFVCFGRCLFVFVVCIFLLLVFVSIVVESGRGEQRCRECCLGSQRALQEASS